MIQSLLIKKKNLYLRNLHLKLDLIRLSYSSEIFTINNGKFGNISSERILMKQREKNGIPRLVLKK